MQPIRLRATRALWLFGRAIAPGDVFACDPAVASLAVESGRAEPLNDTEAAELAAAAGAAREALAARLSRERRSLPGAPASPWAPWGSA